ncbi:MULTISPECIES: NAD(P)H-hydrate dehydratase [unclassified Modicisalibacter]|uniref:NAD(P)H-hydrate dehydratase n=1 Tax=unclassified Modicisalibacter TaxID=2679913 RepID=UPI001CCB1F6F|nr:MULTISPECIES: NAD(P)H-hydrate dehydratase [unclassified Modicisalibacter]MBZ9557430.1 NAD(P)H-hydrate dehydratase [Modicisalibacter sp. R2A 31.J]MBZ9573904.1 NAD(P)H-hydrate dehydratase [Modicisalibacter sp. MOD 31.J]
MSSHSSRSLYLADQVREIDRRVIAASAEPGDEAAGFALMRRAARAAYAELRRRWPEARRLSVLCGAGNNAGDGYVIAALAAGEGLAVQLLAVREPEALKGEAALAHETATLAGLRAEPWRPGTPLNGDVVVDALLGTGLGGEVREPYAAAIDAINASGRPVLAVDIPSGLAADSGAVLGRAVQADLTVTFIADKLGLHTGRAPDHVGELMFRGLGSRAEAMRDLRPVAELLEAAIVAEMLPPRPRSSHKGDFGHVLVLGGAPGFGGAALLASQTAARLGAGKVSLATAPEHVSASLTRTPEVMARGVRGVSDARGLIEAADVIVVGPGLGQDAWGQGLFQAALEAGKPLVVDADALNLLVTHWPEVRRDDWILTPHPGEAGRLLGLGGAEIQADRLAAVRQLQAARGGTVLLKGAGSLVAGPAGIGVCSYGNPGMASGGMGDVLSGLLGALVAQGLSPETAARVGVVLHARAADRAADEHGERGLLAGDLASYARILVNG